MDLCLAACVHNCTINHFLDSRQSFSSTLVKLLKFEVIINNVNNFIRQCLAWFTCGKNGQLLCGKGLGVLDKCLYGEAPPQGSTLYAFIYHFL